MSARSASLCLLLLLQPIGAAAEGNYTISRIHFLPPEYYVGDEVEARIRLSVDAGVVPAAPAEMPAPGPVHIRDILVIPIADEYDVRISFSAYETGSRELPPIELGDIVLTGVQIGAVSILTGENTAIVESFGPELLPSTGLLLALAVGGMLIVPPLIVLAIIWLRRLIKHLIAEWDERRPYKELKVKLDTLADPSLAENSREFYIKLTAAFRDYLSERLSIDIAAHTASELTAELAEKMTGVSPVEKISAELTRFDEAKFGGRGVRRPTRQNDIKKVRDAAAAIEEWKLKVSEHVDA